MVVEAWEDFVEDVNEDRRSAPAAAGEAETEVQDGSDRSRTANTAVGGSQNEAQEGPDRTPDYWHYTDVPGGIAT